MKLYHGTTAKHLESILTDGLVPRGQRENRWGDAPSHKECIYLTNAYGPYFALTAVGEGEKALLLEIEVDQLQCNLLPDEDFLEQATRGQDGYEGSMEQRTAYYRRNLLDHLGWSTWQQSINGLGTCAHLGRIPAEAITRYATWLPSENMELTLNFDPSIILMNFAILGREYVRKTAYILGDVDEPFFPKNGIDIVTLA